MTSATSREDLKSELYSAGIRTPRALQRVMRAIDSYTFGQGRRSGPERTHLCPQCKGEKPEGEFPGEIRSNPSGDYWCTTCIGQSYSGKKPRWKCPACEKELSRDSFPPEKWRNPRIRAKCLNCKVPA